MKIMTESMCLEGQFDGSEVFIFLSYHYCHSLLDRKFQKQNAITCLFFYKEYIFIYIIFWPFEITLENVLQNEYRYLFAGKKVI